MKAMFAEAGIQGVLEAFEGGEPVVVHGPTERLPAWLQSPRLHSVLALCSGYRGRILHGQSRVGPRSTLLANGDALGLLAAGEALYLPDLLDEVEGVSDWLRSFEIALGIPAGCARATAWVAPQEEGTALHLDAEDVVSIQLSGSKSFEVAEPAALPAATGFQFGPGIPAAADLYPQCEQGFPDPAQATFTTIAMQPGSVLVLPRGHWHRTRCDTDSLSVSIVLSPPLMMDHAWAWLRLQALQDPHARRPVYGAPDPDALERISLRWAAAVRQLPSALADADWCDDTLLQWCPTKQLESDESRWLVDTYDGRRDELPEVAGSTVWLQELASTTAAFRLAQARTQWGPDVMPALKALVQVGALYRWPRGARRIEQASTGDGVRA